jgi:hypothetical protein
MKKLILATTFLAAGVVSLLAQGTARVTPSNDPALFGDSQDRLIYNRFIGDPIKADNWTVQIEENRGGVWTPLGAKLTLLSDFGGAYPQYAGQFWTDGTLRQLNVNIGQQTSLRVVVFDGTGALMPGNSGPFNFTHKDSSPNPPSASDTLMFNLPAFAAVPEPSTIALGVLGLGALLLFRRRK